MAQADNVLANSTDVNALVSSRETYALYSFQRQRMVMLIANHPALLTDPGRPHRALSPPIPEGELLLTGAIIVHPIELRDAAARRTKHQKTSIWRPGGGFVASPAGCQALCGAAIDVDDIDIETASIHGDEGDTIPPG
jgi:hypothetical protein